MGQTGVTKDKQLVRYVRSINIANILFNEVALAKLHTNHHHQGIMVSYWCKIPSFIVVLLLSIGLYFVLRETYPAIPPSIAFAKQPLYVPGSVPKAKRSPLQEALRGSLGSLLSSDTLSKYSKSGLYEVWFTFVNAGPESYWIRYTLRVPKEGGGADGVTPLSGSALWFGRFSRTDARKNFMVKKMFPLDAFVGSRWVEKEVKCDDCEVPGAKVIRENLIVASIDELNWIALDGMKGKLETAGGRKIEWDLTFDNFMQPYYPVPWFAYWLGITNTYVANGHPNLRMSGIVRIDGEETQVLDGVPGHQTHTFGDAYSEPWTWFHGNNFEGTPDAFLEVGYKTRLGKGTFAFHTPEEGFFYNTVFSMKKVKDVKKSPSKSVITVEDSKYLITADISVPKESIVGLEYLGPRGNRFYCYNSPLTTLNLTVVEKKTQEVRSWITHDLNYETVWFEPQENLKFLPSDKEDW